MNNNSFKIPLVSIGIPTYNRPDGLRRTLECITRQTYKNLEIIVSDNGSLGSHTEDVVNEFMIADQRVSYYRQARNMGIVFNFKFVFDKATGSYFMWAADDDEWKPKYIESCLELFDDNTSLVCTQMEVIWRIGKNKNKIKLPDINKCVSAYERVCSFLRCAAPSMIYGLHRRSNLKNINVFNSVFDFYDCALLISILSQSNVKISDDLLYSAGIDDCEYKIKPNKIETKSRLKYFPFIVYTIKTIKNCNVATKQKIILILLALRFSTNNYIYHESNYNQSPICRKIELYFVIKLNRIIKLLIEVLTGGDTNVE